MLPLNRLGALVPAPLIVFIIFFLLAGVGLFLLLSHSLDNSARRNIEQNLHALALTAYSKANNEIDRCTVTGLDCLRGTQKTIHQRAVFKFYEDFARTHEIGLIVEDQGLIKFTAGIEEADAQVVSQSSGGDGQHLLQAPGAGVFHRHTIQFEPWAWRVSLLKNTSAVANPMSAMGIIYFGIWGILSMVTLAFLLWLRQTILGPVHRIANDFAADRTPKYQGISELEYLVGKINSAMNVLREKTLYLETMLQSMSDGIAVFDADRRLVVWNKRYIELYRYPPELIQSGVNLVDLIRYSINRGDYGPVDARMKLDELLKRTRMMAPPDFDVDPNTEAQYARMPDGSFARTYTDVTYREWGQTTNPSRFDMDHANSASMEVRRTPMPNGGFVTTHTDITDRKEAIRLEIANNAKSQFLQNISHDLRKPIAAIIEDTGLLLEATDEAAFASRRGNLNRVSISSRYLLNMVDKVLEMSRIEAGQVEVNLRHLDIQPIIVQAKGVIDARARAKGLQIRLDTTDKLQGTTDPLLLLRTLINLVSNAVDYTIKGGIAIRAQQSGGTLKISVADTGIGIAEDKLAIIFEKFQRAKPAGAAGGPAMGLGLGLTISRELTHLLRGTITVASTLGKGSVFTVSIPIRHQGVRV